MRHHFKFNDSFLFKPQPPYNVALNTNFRLHRWGKLKEKARTRNRLKFLLAAVMNGDKRTWLKIHSLPLPVFLILLPPLSFISLFLKTFSLTSVLLCFIIFPSWPSHLKSLKKKSSKKYSAKADQNRCATKGFVNNLTALKTRKQNVWNKLEMILKISHVWLRRHLLHSVLLFLWHFYRNLTNSWLCVS